MGEGYRILERVYAIISLSFKGRIFFNQKGSIMAHTKEGDSQKKSDKEFARLIEEVGEQYRVYKQLHDVVHLVQSLPESEPAVNFPTLEHPNIGTLSVRK